MNKRNQEIREGLRTLSRTVYRIVETGHTERGYVRYARKWWVVRRTSRMMWWRLARPARAEEVAAIRGNRSQRSHAED
jgi:hypothetical protein